MYKPIFSFLIILGASTSALAGSYTAYIKQIQAEGIGDPYNTVHLDLDVTDSPCSRTNSANRFEIVNNAQHSAALAALLVGKKVTINTTGQCNTADIEKANYIMLKASE